MQCCIPGKPNIAAAQEAILHEFDMLYWVARIMLPVHAYRELQAGTAGMVDQVHQRHCAIGC